MKIENQCCSYEQAKKLKELGVAQLGIFCYNLNGDLYGVYSKHDYYSAFTVAELGVMLPNIIKVGKSHYYLEYEMNGYHYTLGYEDVEDGSLLICSGDNEAEVRASALISLFEKKHLSPADINARITNS